MFSQEEWLQWLNLLVWAIWTALVALITRWLAKRGQQPLPNPLLNCSQQPVHFAPTAHPTASGSVTPTAERDWFGTPPPAVDESSPTWAPISDRLTSQEAQSARLRRAANGPSTGRASRRTPRTVPVPAVHRHLPLGSESSHWHFYAVAYGRRIGIFRTWEECAEQVQGYPGARYRGFHCIVEAARWLGWWSP